MLELVVAGCGAVFEQLHASVLRQLSRSGAIRVAALVDPDRVRVSRHLARFPRAEWFPTLEAAAAKRTFAAALIASPPAYHRQQVETAFRLGCHVLCEKPLATSTADARAMAEAAKVAGRILAVGQTRRFFPGLALAAKLIESGSLGEQVEFCYREGGVWGWPIASFAPFLRASSGGGVLTDKGVHVLDSLLWIFGEMRVVKAADDSLVGGVEGNSWLELTGPNVRGTVQLSWDQGLNGGLTIRGPKGTLRVQPDEFRWLEFCPSGESWRRIPAEATWPVAVGQGQVPATAPRDYQDCVYLQWVAFVRAVQHGERVPVDGNAAVIPISQIEEAYRIASPLPQKWLSPEEQVVLVQSHWKKSSLLSA